MNDPYLDTMNAFVSVLLEEWDWDEDVVAALRAVSPKWDLLLPRMIEAALPHIAEIDGEAAYTALEAVRELDEVGPPFTVSAFARATDLMRESAWLAAGGLRDARTIADSLHRVLRHLLRERRAMIEKASGG